MNISLEKYQQDLQKNYLALKKASEQVKKDYQKVINDSFTENNWNDEGRKITLNMRNFENIVRDLGKKVDYLQNADIEINDIQSTIKKVESEIYNAKTNIEPMIQSIREKVKTYACNFELAANKEEQKIKEEKGQEILQDLMNNKEVLMERRKNLEIIHKTAANLKSITDQMAIDVNNQGAILDEIEAKVEDSKDKAEKAKEEVIAADKISKSNKKCYIFFVIIALASLVGIGI
jgi:t-SNARE complex subunit (syntaxin)